MENLHRGLTQLSKCQELLKYQEPMVTRPNTDICWYLFSTSEYFYAF